MYASLLLLFIIIVVRLIDLYYSGYFIEISKKCFCTYSSPMLNKIVLCCVRFEDIRNLKCGAVKGLNVAGNFIDIFCGLK